MECEIGEYRAEYASDIVEGVWIQVRGTRFGKGDGLRVVVACEDITEVKTAEASLGRLTGNLLRRQDEERRRNSSVVHDATAQNLLGAPVGIGQAVRLAPRVERSAEPVADTRGS